MNLCKCNQQIFKVNKQAWAQVKEKSPEAKILANIYWSFMLQRGVIRGTRIYICGPICYRGK